MRVITVPRFDEHSSPLSKRLQILKFTHLITLRMTMFMYKYYRRLLPLSLNNLFTPVYQIHSYDTRLSSNLCFSLPKIRTNLGLFSIRYQGAKTWNVLSEADKQMTFLQFKRKIKADFISQYYFFLFKDDCLFFSFLIFLNSLKKHNYCKIYLTIIV